MSDKQMVIPGLEPPAQSEQKTRLKPLTTRKKIADLQARVFWLEIETTRLAAQSEGDRDHA